MRKKPTPINFIPEGSFLTFIKQTIVGWRKRRTGERVQSEALYRCQCGREKELVITEVKRGKTKSCGGCGIFKEKKRRVVTKHGMWNTPLYNIYMSMIRRCYNPNNTAYKWYGARGVRVCDEWKNDFMSFYNWAMANGWNPQLNVDKDKKGGGLLYSPETCSLISLKENQNNRSSNVLFSYNGETKTLSQWAELLEMNYSTLWSRINKQDWSFESAITKPIRQCSSR